MRRAVLLLGSLAALCLFASACGADGRVEVPGEEGRFKSSALERAARRAYDGAPPVIPHEPFGAACIACHGDVGMEVEGVGYAPPSPHEATQGLSAMSNCRQCHVFRRTVARFASNSFSGLAQDLRRGRRLNAAAPPTIPHKTFMRENCLACHSGPAAREEIRTSHPERTRCTQCHVPVRTTATFSAGAGRADRVRP